MKVSNKYKGILKQSKNIDFFSPAKMMLEENFYSEKELTLYTTTVMAIAPALISYVMWIIKDAMQKNISKLYFLSRDGYILKKIAQQICHKYDILIECRYFYCSRQSLHTPLFTINPDESLSKLCGFSLKTTPEIILKRVGFSDEEIRTVIHQLIAFDINTKLHDDNISIFEKELKENELFNSLMEVRSNLSLSIIQKYIKQEGMTDHTPYAIVDSGWSGSMQRAIRQILNNMNDDRCITGYYFGMFVIPKKEDGNYNCYFFSPNNTYKRTINFNHNIFECVCSANHGMVIGYRQQEKIVPAFGEYQSSWNIELQLDAIKRYTTKFLVFNNANVLGIDVSKIVCRLFTNLMMNPSAEEAKLYGNISFCDDISDAYCLKLSNHMSFEDIKQNFIPWKIIRRIFNLRYVQSDFVNFWNVGSYKLYYRRFFFLLRYNEKANNLIAYNKLILKQKRLLA